MWRFVVLALGLLVLVGCGSQQRESRAPVKGTVTYKNRAVNGATLILYPKSGTPVTIGLTQEGTFEVPDVLEGEYVVVVQPSKGFAGPSTEGMDPAKVAEMQSKMDTMKRPATIHIPEKYSNQATSDLRVTVTKGGPALELVLKD
jgi:hypothetical protein